jgi:hypothetical protein
MGQRLAAAATWEAWGSGGGFFSRGDSARVEGEERSEVTITFGSF